MGHSVACKRICVTVIHVHEITVSRVIGYPSHGVTLMLASGVIASTRVSTTANKNNDSYILNTVGATKLLYIQYQFIGYFTGDNC